MANGSIKRAPNKRAPNKAPLLRAKIERAHIDAALPKDSSHCMIAEAIKASTPGALSVAVDLATIRYTDEVSGIRYVYLTPRIAQLALLSFDQGQVPEPFEIKTRAAQIIPSRRGYKGKSAYQKRELATPEGGGANSVPVIVGGEPLPRGPLGNGGTGTNNGQPKAALRTGRRREFGLGVMGR